MLTGRGLKKLDNSFALVGPSLRHFVSFLGKSSTGLLLINFQEKSLCL
jgi:hypothetical protein